ncbi:o-succinylbenzoic acid (OSB) synthetase [Planococcus antarcticus DSM 14505]|uniref:o-succinylbenzoate synthase n=1 Tax=Planococcus antarcticus DSM 14505 TaxID=1185653 RepID=A0AA87IIF1_9BACL|nr:o-succinylbenzoate synthase [Planococcus antarcticus]EIM05391.1 o-succinylbenzoic acid (OSB) synthetase [Planococcus antarcticus DSM 14505]
MAVIIEGIHLETVRQPLKTPFNTVLQQVTEREVIVVAVTGDSRDVGYGECVAFETPWYNEETISSCRFVLEQVLMPVLTNKTIEHPQEVWELFKVVKGNRMAKAAIEMAVWDLFAKQQEEPLWKFVGGTQQSIPAGVVVAADPSKIKEQVAQAAKAGYQRIKIKIHPDSEPSFLKTVVYAYPELQFFADANGSFSGHRLDRLKEFDEVGFTLIEQPFGERQWDLHTQAKKQLKTKICLDESICSVEDVQQMIDLEAGDIIVLKMSRLGGWTETLKVIDLCKANTIGMWVGGMIEFGVSKAHNLALASLPGINYPGDFSASAHFWEKDIIEPEISVENGKIFLSERPGIGYKVV